jgi:hypothetical protein
MSGVSHSTEQSLHVPDKEARHRATGTDGAGVLRGAGVLKPSTSAAVRLFGCACFAVGTAMCAIIEGMANNWSYTVIFILACMFFVGFSVIALAELFAEVSNEEGLLP